MVTRFVFILFFSLLGQGISAQTVTDPPTWVLKPIIDIIDVDENGNPSSFYKRIAYRKIPPNWSQTQTVNDTLYYLTKMSTRDLTRKIVNENDLSSPEVKYWAERFMVKYTFLIHDFRNNEIHESIKFNMRLMNYLKSRTSGLKPKTGTVDMGYFFRLSFPLNGGRTEELVQTQYGLKSDLYKEKFQQMLEEMASNPNYRILIKSSASSIVADGADSEQVNTQVSNDRLVSAVRFFVTSYNQANNSAPLNVNIDSNTLQLSGNSNDVSKIITDSQGITFNDIIDNEVNVDQAVSFRLIML